MRPKIQPLVRHLGKGEKFIGALLGETRESVVIRDANFIAEQVFARQLSYGHFPAFVQMQNSLKTEAHPGMNETSENTCIVATHPLTEDEEQNQKRTYVMYVTTLQAFVEFTFSGEIGDTTTERDVIESMDLIAKRKRAPSRPTKKHDYFEAKQPDMWDSPYRLGVNLNALELHGDKMTIQQSTPERFLQAAAQGFSQDDSYEKQLLTYTEDAIRTLPTNELGELSKISAQLTTERLI